MEPFCLEPSFILCRKLTGGATKGNAVTWGSALQRPQPRASDFFCGCSWNIRCGFCVDPHYWASCYRPFSLLNHFCLTENLGTTVPGNFGFCSNRFATQFWFFSLAFWCSIHFCTGDGLQQRLKFVQQFCHCVVLGRPVKPAVNSKRVLDWEDALMTWWVVSATQLMFMATLLPWHHDSNKMSFPRVCPSREFCSVQIDTKATFWRCLLRSFVQVNQHFRKTLNFRCRWDQEGRDANTAVPGDLWRIKALRRQSGRIASFRFTQYLWTCKSFILTTRRAREFAFWPE